MEVLWWDGLKKKLNYKEKHQKCTIVGKMDVVVEVAYAGVCGSDFAYMKGNMGKHNAKEDGVILGHEFCGTVSQVGEDVSGYKVGDKVAVDPNISCDGCPGDKESPQFCENNEAIGVKRDGGWSQFCKVPVSQVYKVPTSLPLDVAALAEPFSCVLRGWKNIEESCGGKVSNKRKTLVQGAGIIGSLFTLLLRHHGFSEVTIAEIKEERRDAVKEFLPTNYKVQHPDVITSSLNDADVDGFSLVIDCTGVTQVFQQDVKLARRGAVILLFGCCASKQTIEVEPFLIYWKELKILGSFLNPYCFRESIQLLCDVSSQHPISLPQMGVGKFQLRDFEQAFDELRSGSASKVLFEF